MAKQEKNDKCPCCGAPVEERIGVGNGLPYMGPVQQALFNVVKGCPEGIGTTDVYERVWGNRVARSISIVPTTIKHVNRKIAPWGLKIKGAGGPGSTYRLMNIDAVIEPLSRVTIWRRKKRLERPRTNLISDSTVSAKTESR